MNSWFDGLLLLPILSYFLTLDGNKRDNNLEQVNDACFGTMISS